MASVPWARLLSPTTRAACTAAHPTRHHPIRQRTDQTIRAITRYLSTTNKTTTSTTPTTNTTTPPVPTTTTPTRPSSSPSSETSQHGEIRASKTPPSSLNRVTRVSRRIFKKSRNLPSLRQTLSFPCSPSIQSYIHSGVYLIGAASRRFSIPSHFFLLCHPAAASHHICGKPWGSRHPAAGGGATLQDPPGRRCSAMAYHTCTKVCQ